MVRQEERSARSLEAPLVGGLPDVPGILVAMHLSSGLGAHLRGLADELLVKPFPRSTLTRAERELLATAVSAGNACFYCMDSHGAFAREHLLRAGVADSAADEIIESVKGGGSTGLNAKMHELLGIARIVQRSARALTHADVTHALEAGATDGDVQLAVVIASGFSMYNRLVDGLRARTPESEAAYRARAAEIADYGYSDPKVSAIPR